MRYARNPWILALWVLTALACWAALGAVVGAALRLAGRSGARVLARTASPWAWLLGACGWKRAAALLGR